MSYLPTEKILTFEENTEYPLNLVLLSDKPATDEYLMDASIEEPAKFKAITREMIQLWIHHKTDAIYVYASLHASILQW